MKQGDIFTQFNDSFLVLGAKDIKYRDFQYCLEHHRKPNIIIWGIQYNGNFDMDNIVQHGKYVEHYFDSIVHIQSYLKTIDVNDYIVPIIKRQMLGEIETGWYNVEECFIKNKKLDT